MRVWVGLSLVVLGFALLWSQESYGARKLPVIRIGTVADGPSERLTEIRRLFEREILELTRGEMDVRFPPKKQLNGAWSVTGVRRAVDRLLADRSIDLVITPGVIASNEVSLRKRLPKPVIAPFVIDAKLQGLPLKKGTSGVKNLNYLDSFKSFERAVKAFTEILPFAKLTVLVDQLFRDAFPLLRGKTRQIATDNNITITTVTVGTSIKPALDALPADTEAVFVTALLRIPSSEFDLLVSALIARRLPSFSLFGREDVERGLLASVAPKADAQRLARRVALNVQQVLLGQDAGKLEVAFSTGERLTINMATARAIDKWPSFRVLTEAELLNEEIEEVPRRLSLYRVVREAVSVNLDLAAADRRVAAGLGQVGQARAALLPQVNIGSQALMIDEDRASASFGNRPERTAIATGGLNQLIYSDDAWANYTIQEKTQLSREEERRQLRLDIAQEAAIAYLNVLRAKTTARIQKDNLKLTRSNLELARVRESVGYAARDEVFRWESELANGRIAVLDAQADRRQAAVSLNRLLYRPLEEPFMTEEEGLDDPLLVTSEKQFFYYVDNPRNFSLFRDFLAQEGLKAAPELHRLDALIAGQDRTVLNAQRAFWLPDISLESEVAQRYASGGAGQGTSPLAGASQDKTQWTIGLELSFPLFSGGAKDATQMEANEALRELRLEREATVGRIEESIRSALYQSGASFPSIRLSREAAEAAQKNLELVGDQYSRGTVDIIKLLDSQNAALAANEAASNAVYDFLIDLMNVQRAIGRFDYFVYEEERIGWFQRLQSFFAKAGVPPFKE